MQIVVIGGGVIGLMTARELSLAGCQVCVIEQGRPGHEASWAGGGILSPLYPWRYPESVNRLAAWSQQHYPALAESLGDEGGVDPEWTRSGILVLDPEEHDAARAWASTHAMPCQQLDPQAYRELEPGLQEISDSALWFPDLAQIRNPRMLKSLVTSCLRHGVRLLEGQAVTGIGVQDGRVTSIQTATETLPADKVIVASGAWSGQLLAKLGIEIPVRPVRGQMIQYRASPGLVRHINLYRGHYLIPRRDGRVLVGSTLEETAFDKSTTAAARASLEAFAVNLIPALAQMPVENHWAGLRPGSPEGIPYICPVSGIQGLYLNTGHYRNGLVLGYASARLLADLVIGRQPIVDPAPYSQTTPRHESLSGIF